MPEWLIGAVLKTARAVKPSGVRIPLPPPVSNTDRTVNVTLFDGISGPAGIRYDHSYDHDPRRAASGGERLTLDTLSSEKA
jgi:hypothetical protein